MFLNYEDFFGHMNYLGAKSELYEDIVITVPKIFPFCINHSWSLFESDTEVVKWHCKTYKLASHFELPNIIIIINNNKLFLEETS